MRHRTISLILCGAAVLVALVWVGVGLRTCHVHHRQMETRKVPVGFALGPLSDDYQRYTKVRAALFPHSSDEIVRDFGDANRGGQGFERVWVCPTCDEAREQWLKQTIPGYGEPPKKFTAEDRAVAEESYRKTFEAVRAASKAFPPTTSPR
jgi:hypothetical protein